MWPEVSLAKNDKRREFVLTGTEISNRISKDGLDPCIFILTDLNYLSITDTCLSEVPDDIKKLINLQTLVLHSNKIQMLNEDIGTLQKLKTLDVSRNLIKQVPDSIKNLSQIVSLNFSNNKIETFPLLSSNTKLSLLDLSNNKLTTFPVLCKEELANLSELKLHQNEIEEIPNSINALPSLKLFDISNNKIKTLPGELADCPKLKDINLKSNPIIDKRLLKLIDQCRTKQIIDYVKQHCPKTSSNDCQGGKKGKKGKGQKKNNEDSDDNEENSTEYKHTITIKHAKDDSLKIIQLDLVKVIRQHIVCCIVNGISFTEDTFKKFIQLQNKLHDSICEKRNCATIATHDYKKLGNGDLVYTTLAPEVLLIKPLNRPVEMTGAELFTKLQTEANNLRKEKKRNTYSGIHKYLYLIEGKPAYPCLLNDKKEVVSFPPITNSDISKIELGTTKIFLEVTSSLTQFVCKKVLNELLKEMAFLFGKDMEVEQFKVVDQEETLKVVYPSKTDLVFDKNVPIKIVRE